MYYFFFFSSRRRHTRYIGDWSSDVCSSDLHPRRGEARQLPPDEAKVQEFLHACGTQYRHVHMNRSEERRVGKEGRYRWRVQQYKEKRMVTHLEQTSSHRSTQSDLYQPRTVY